MWKSDTDRLAVSEAKKCFPCQNTFQATVCKQKFQSFMKIKSIVLQQCSVRLVTSQDSSCFQLKYSTHRVQKAALESHLPNCRACSESFGCSKGFFCYHPKSRLCPSSSPLSCACPRWGWLSLLILLWLMQLCLGLWTHYPAITKWSSGAALVQIQTVPAWWLHQTAAGSHPRESQLIICIVILCEQ